ncbi:hypothetical protein GCM10009554_49700 [Kribbella koreensis]|uniref:Uncharacterized protein n=1 Tax=Kribbella koreensis TaxID=57909 RepID=A0ABN1R0I4_9ACTN
MPPCPSRRINRYGPIRSSSTSVGVEGCPPVPDMASTVRRDQPNRCPATESFRYDLGRNRPKARSVPSCSHPKERQGDRPMTHYAIANLTNVRMGAGIVEYLQTIDATLATDVLS